MFFTILIIIQKCRVSSEKNKNSFGNTAVIVVASLITRSFSTDRTLTEMFLPKNN